MADRQGELDRKVEEALRDRKSNLVEGGRETEFLCPVHGDTNRASAQWNKAKNTWHCKTCGAGGSTADLAEHLGIRTKVTAPDARIDRTYPYRDAAGNVAYEVVRYIPKSFKIRRPDPTTASGYTWKRPEKLILYRLPDVLAAGPDDWVVLVEGEKDADAGADLGIEHITTSPFGAQDARGDGKPTKIKWQASYTEPLAGKNVLVCLDADSAGQYTARQLMSILRPHTQRVVRMDLPGLPTERNGQKLKDLHDWIHGLGHTLADFWAAAAAAIAAPDEVEPTVEEPENQTPDEMVLGFAETDSGNGELFAHLYGKNSRFDHQRKRWLLWKGDRWGEDVDGQLYRWGKEQARKRARAAINELDGAERTRVLNFGKRSESKGSIEATLAMAGNEPPIADNGKGWDSNPFLLGVGNGVVNLTTGELRAGKQEDRITLSTHVNYDPAARAPRWEAFLREVFTGHEGGTGEMVAYLHRAIGYSVTGSTREQVYFMLHGAGANGKSTLLEVLGRALGDYTGNLPFSALQKGKEQSIPTDLAELPGKRLVTASETQERSTLNEARIKALTGGDTITARQLYQRQFQFVPELKLWMAMNHLPNVDDASEGLWRRVRVIEFQRQFSKEERQGDLKEQLFEELPGILTWCVKGALEWLKSGLADPACVLIATNEYRERSDPLNDFIRDRCVRDGNMRVQATTLFKSYLGWAMDMGYTERDRMNSTKFGRVISEKYEKKHYMTGWYYLGLGLKADYATNPSPYETDNDGFEKPVELKNDENDGLTGSETFFLEPKISSRGKLKNPSTRQPVISICVCNGRHGDDGQFCPGAEAWFDAAERPHCDACHPYDHTFGMAD